MFPTTCRKLRNSAAGRRGTQGRDRDRGRDRGNCIAIDGDYRAPKIVSLFVQRFARRGLLAF